MTTFARRIDALGRYHPDPRYGMGYGTALSDANDIAVEADELVAELIETIEDVLSGAQPLARWAEQAAILVRRAKERCQ